MQTRQRPTIGSAPLKREGAFINFETGAPSSAEEIASYRQQEEAEFCKRFISALMSRAHELMSDSTLRYHNFEHVEGVFSAYSDLFAEEPTAIESAAIAFHDVVYVPGSAPGVNEELSAIMLGRHLRDIEDYLDGPSGIDVDAAKALILATKVENHISPTFDLTNPSQSVRRILDSDLAALASSDYMTFVKFQHNIIREYAGRLPMEQHESACQRSATFLAQFLDKPFIYLTAEGRERYEPRARHNIRKYLAARGEPQLQWNWTVEDA